MYELTFNELQTVNGGGTISDSINATLGGVLVANGGIVAGAAVAIGACTPLFAVGLGIALVGGGAYCLWNALT